MRMHGVLAILVTISACEQPTDPCASSTAKPVLEIRSVQDPATGASASRLELSSITRDGEPADTTDLRTNLLRNIERTPTGLACTLPCTFGQEPGIWAFDVRAAGFYPAHQQVAADYMDVPAGCPAAHGRPTSVSILLTEADSARAKFSHVMRQGTGLASAAVSVMFDDGSGARTVGVEWPWQTYVTRNSGTLHARFVVMATDTIAVGAVDLPLRKDWLWGIGAYIQDRNPATESFCIQSKSFPLRRPVPGADSLYIGWGGASLSTPSAC